MREKRRLARKGLLFSQLIEALGPSDEGPDPVLPPGTPSLFDQLGPVDETVEKLLDDAQQIAERQLNEPRGRGMGKLRGVASSNAPSARALNTAKTIAKKSGGGSAGMLPHDAGLAFRHYEKHGGEPFAVGGGPASANSVRLTHQIEPRSATV